MRKWYTDSRPKPLKKSQTIYIHREIQLSSEGGDSTASGSMLGSKSNSTGTGWAGWEVGAGCTLNRYPEPVMAEMAWWTTAGPESDCYGKLYALWSPEERLKGEEKSLQLVITSCVCVYIYILRTIRFCQREKASSLCSLTLLLFRVQLSDFHLQTIHTLAQRVHSDRKRSSLDKQLPKHIFCIFACNKICELMNLSHRW